MFQKTFAFAMALAGVTSWGQTGAGNANLSGSASSVLEHSRLARTAILASQPDRALFHVKEALGLTAEIFQKTDTQARPVLAPLSTDVERVTTYAPVKRGKGGDPNQAKLHKHTSVRDVEENYTRVALNVSLAADRLQNARQLLEKGDMAGADSQLAEVQTAVVVQAGSARVPLLKARENLELARTRILERKWKEAAMPLRSAAQSLQDYFAVSTGSQSLEVRNVKSEIDALANRIGKKPPEALDRINSWIAQVEQWNPQPSD